MIELLEMKSLIRSCKGKEHVHSREWHFRNGGCLGEGPEDGGSTSSLSFLWKIRTWAIKPSPFRLTNLAQHKKKEEKSKDYWESSPFPQQSQNLARFKAV